MSKNISADRTAGFWSVFLHSFLIFLFLCSTPCDGASTAASRPPNIEVIYPKPGQTIGAVDSTFIFGNLPVLSNGSKYRLAINDHSVKVHPNGGFIAFLPIKPGLFEFRLEAWLVQLRTVPKTKLGRRIYKASIALDWPDHLIRQVEVNVPRPQQQLSYDSLAVIGDYNPPSGDLVLSAGDRLQVSFTATPGCRAWFSIEGVVDSVPMSESVPYPQAYWGESVFGDGSVLDSMKLRGIYEGFLDISSEMRADTVSVVYHIGPPTPGTVIERFLNNPLKYHKYLASFLISDSMLTTTTESSYRSTLNSPDYPFTVRLVDSVQIIRHGPRKGYFSIFQPEGVEVEVVGAEGDWYQVRLAKSQTGWVYKESVRRLSPGILPPRSDLRAVRTFALADRTRIEFPLSGKHAFRVIEEDRRTMRLQLFGVRSDTDWIRYDFSGDLIDLATWLQPEENLWELKLSLNENLYGYDTFYKGNIFCLELIKPPTNLHKLKGKRIVIDPGHSSDPGAIGPTGLTEAEANLAIALEVRDELVRHGARVIMTREDSSHVDLYDRPVIAKSFEADLFISIHNNALPDGVNPFENNGTSTYYYHLHSIDLARAVHRRMLKATKLDDYGLYHGNLAVNRPTQYPAILVECAFIIIPEQEALIQTKKFQHRVAKAIRKGIEDYFNVIDKQERDRGVCCGGR